MPERNFVEAMRADCGCVNHLNGLITFCPLHVAAPDLLDVAKAIVTAIEGQMLVLPTHVEKHLLDGAHAAIRKAMEGA